MKNKFKRSHVSHSQSNSHSQSPITLVFTTHSHGHSYKIQNHPNLWKTNHTYAHTTHPTSHIHTLTHDTKTLGPYSLKSWHATFFTNKFFFLYRKWHAIIFKNRAPGVLEGK
jgi:hypothetical protein